MKMQLLRNEEEQFVWNAVNIIIKMYSFQLLFYDPIHYLQTEPSLIFIVFPWTHGFIKQVGRSWSTLQLLSLIRFFMI